MNSKQLREVNAQELMNHSRRKMRQKQNEKQAKESSEPETKMTRKRKIGQAVFSRQVINGKQSGRPSELNMEIAARICAHFQAGLFIQSALQAEQVPRRTYYKWIEQGERDLEAGKNSIFSEFLHMIKKTEVEVETRNILAVQAGESGWQGAAWWLERRLPARWGNRMRLSLEEAQDFARKLLGVLIEEIPDRAVVERIVSKMSKIEGKQREFVASK